MDADDSAAPTQLIQGRDWFYTNWLHRTFHIILFHFASLILTPFLSLQKILKALENQGQDRVLLNQKKECQLQDLGKWTIVIFLLQIEWKILSKNILNLCQYDWITYVRKVEITIPEIKVEI